MGEILKVGLAGTSCVGKTAIIDIARATMSDVAIVDEAAREWFMDHPEVNDRYGIVAQGAIQNLARRKEEAAHDLVKGSAVLRSVLTDRTIWDAPVCVASTSDILGANELYERGRRLATYSKIFLLDPAGIPYEQDTIRQESAENRANFHIHYLEFFEERDISYELLGGSLEERVTRVQDALHSPA